MQVVYDDSSDSDGNTNGDGDGDGNEGGAHLMSEFWHKEPTPLSGLQLTFLTEKI